MAKLNAATTTGIEGQPILITLAASLCVMLCMIVSLLGIKLWWFKHRLTFDQSSTRNGAAGGNPPAVVRSSRDKRLSQQFTEPTMEYGVFRQRQEDELDIERPNQLPPVRLRKLSQSTPNLLMPPLPKRRNKVQSVAYDDFEPPVRQPPRPPISVSPTPTPTPTAVPSFEDFERQFQRVQIHQPHFAKLERINSKEDIFEPSPVPSIRSNMPTFEAVDHPEFAKMHMPNADEIIMERTISKEDIFEPSPLPSLSHSRSNLNEEYERQPWNSEISHIRESYLKDSTSAAQSTSQHQQQQTVTALHESSMENLSSFAEIEKQLQEADINRNRAKFMKKNTANEDIFEPVPQVSAAQPQITMTNDFESEFAEAVFEPTPPEPPRRLNRSTSREAKGSAATGSKFLKAKFAAETDANKIAERRLTGFLRPDEFDIENMQKMDEFEEREHNELETVGHQHKPMRFIKYEEVDVQGAADQHEHWSTLQIGVTEKHLIKKESEEATADLKVQSSKDQLWDTEHSSSYPIRRAYEPQAMIIYSESEDDEVKKINDDYNKNLRKLQDFQLDDNNETEKLFAVQRSVQFNVQENETKEEERIPISKQRRPTGFVRDTEQLWEQNLQQPTTDFDRQWSEMERNIANDFENSIQEEFNKIRNSLVQHEGNFLDVGEQLQELNRDINKKLAAPKGFGKNIDEDWENFENLENASIKIEEIKNDEHEEEENKKTEAKAIQEVKFKLPDWQETEMKESALRTERRHTGYVSSIEDLYKELDIDSDAGWHDKPAIRIEYPDGKSKEIMKGDSQDDELKFKPTVTFKLADWEQTQEKESTLRNERRPTGYIKNIEELYHELDMNDDNVDATTHDTRKVTCEVQEYMERPLESSRIKERRPTGYVKRTLSIEDDYETQQDFKQDIEAQARKPKPRHKVTFDFNTEEILIPATNAGAEVLTHATINDIPKPMQRLTKMHYNDEPVLKVPEPPTTSILFSSQVSQDDSVASNESDSWSAIRQHRHLTEEFQQISTSQQFIKQESTPQRGEAPKPAYRNPLAQMAIQQKVNMVKSAEYQNVLVAKPRTIKDINKKQKVNFDNGDYNSSTTEA